MKFQTDAPGSPILVVSSRTFRLKADNHLVLHSTWSTWTLDSCHLLLAHGSGSRPGCSHAANGLSVLFIWLQLGNIQKSNSCEQV